MQLHECRADYVCAFNSSICLTLRRKGSNNNQRL